MKPVVLEIGCGHFSDFQIWRWVKNPGMAMGQKKPGTATTAIR